MISREYMERYYPDFVKKLDELLAEANKFNRSMKTELPPPRPKGFSKSPKGHLQKAVKEVLAETAPEPVAVRVLIARCNTTPASMFKCVKLLAKREQIVRVERGWYTLK